MSVAYSPSLCRRARGGSRHTWPHRGLGRQRTAAPCCADPYKPSGEPARRTGMSAPMPGLAPCRSAGARSGNPAHWSTSDCRGRMASVARLVRSSRPGCRVAPCEQRASGRTFHAPECPHSRQRHTGHQPSLCATGLARGACLAVADSSEPRRVQLHPCSDPSGRRSQVCTWPSSYYTMCQGCHLHYDREHHAETARATRDAATGQGTLL